MAITISQKRPANSINYEYIAAWFLKWGFLLIMAALTLFPIAYAIFGAFKSNQELTSSPYLFPQTWSLTNFTEALRIANFGRYIWNTLFLVFWTMIGSLVTSSMTAYCLSRREFP